VADSAITKWIARPGVSFATRYGLALASVTGALLLELLFHHFNLPHPFAAFALSAIAITFWYGGTKPGIVAVLLSSLVRSFIVEGATSSLSRALYNVVFLLFAVLMIWIRRSRDALAVADRTARLTAANEELRREKEQLDGLFELSPDAVILTDEDFHVLRVNKEFTRMFEYTAEEVAGKWLPELIMPEELRAEALKSSDQLSSGDRVELETIRQRKDGVRFDVSVVARGISLGAEQVGVYLIYRDISERKKVERKLRRSEANFLESQRLMRMCSWAYDPSSGMVTFSPEAKRIFDIKSDQDMWPGDFFRDRIHPEDRPVHEEIFRRARLNKTDYEVSYRIVLPDGSIKHLYSVAHPVLNQSGELVEFFGTSMDVTVQRKARAELEKAFEEIKQRTEALRRSEAYLAEAQKLTHTGSWAVRVPQMENVYWSKEMFRIFGLDSDLTPPMEVGRRLHPEDASYFTPVIEHAIRDRTDFETDYRILLPNGAAKYIHVVGHPVVNASGDVVELVGTAMDVTEQHEARAALQTAFEQIKAEETELRRMTDAIASYIYVLRPDGTAVYANQTVLDYTGLTLEDVQREDQRARVFHPEDLERLRKERDEALARGKPFELEQRALGKDGNYRWFLVRFNPLRDDQGNIIRWYATGTDIEDRKQAEERMRNENVALREQIDQVFMFEEIVGASPALQRVLSSIVKVAPTDSTVLITGETGTGKELIARAIHKHSQRSGQAFISVNCASIPSSLIASELFGHEKGAFTGAVQRRQGRFEMAHSGTIFLDEVGELPAETQIALLRVLQERQFERVGGNRTLPTDVRVIAATNRDLTAAIAAGTFRTDLFYRLNVFPIEVPPLRKRKEDIPMLVEYFVKRYADKAGKQICKIDHKTLELCQSYPWPGNIRELQNIVERSVILCGGDTFWIEKAWLASAHPPRPELAGPLPDTLQNQEREIIETALAQSKGKVAGPEGAAAKLGIPPSTLDTKIKHLGIKKHRFISK
jgi:PAS domain S-box-containing protein